jgi:hypothetical protein
VSECTQLYWPSWCCMYRSKSTEVMAFAFVPGRTNCHGLVSTGSDDAK